MVFQKNIMLIISNRRNDEEWKKGKLVVRKLKMNYNNTTTQISGLHFFGRTVERSVGRAESPRMKNIFPFPSLHSSRPAGLEEYLMRNYGPGLVGELVDRSAIVLCGN